MVLVGVQVDSVHSLRAVLKIVQDVITSTGNGQDHIITRNVQESMVNARILPGECVDVLILELGVLRELIIVKDPVVVVLVECGGQRKVRV